MIEGWIPSVGSSRIRRRGRATRARAIASCCCWPPDRSPPRRPSMSFSTGNRVKISSGMWRRPRGRVANPVCEVLLDREAREDFAALRHQREAGAGALVRRQRGQVAVLPADPAGADRVEAEDRAQQAGLADPVAAEDAGDLALLRGQADLAQGMAGAVVEIDRLDGQHRPGGLDVEMVSATCILSARDRLR